MNFKLDISEEKLKDDIKDNKELLIVISVFGASLLLFLIFILPGILNFPSKMSERSVELEKLNQIKTAKKILETMNKNQLEEELELATKVLPTNRNFELILGAISEAATRSNSVVTGYKFSTSPNKKEVDQEQYPKLIFEIDLAGEIEEAANFSEQLNKIYPISEVTEIIYENGLSTVTVSFYYKPFTQVNAQDVALARDRNEDEKKALKEISSWNQFTVNQAFIQEVSSESASPF